MRAEYRKDKVHKKPRYVPNLPVFIFRLYMLWKEIGSRREICAYVIETPKQLRDADEHVRAFFNAKSQSRKDAKTLSQNYLRLRNEK